MISPSYVKGGAGGVMDLVFARVTVPKEKK